MFRSELTEVLNSYLTEEENEIIRSIMKDFERNLHVIDEVYYGLLVANIVMPFNVHLENARSRIPYEMNDTMVLPNQIFDSLEKLLVRLMSF
ncbi:hypothetical protein KHA80_06290 [Anaerobacillus sp. HL2]|nr:hypothetical protein KHA80_06290 [Anaerobacillus sp. HL2]